MVSVLERAQAREIRVHTIRFAVWCVSDARLVSIDYRVTVADDHTRSVNERLSHHRVVSGQLHNAQTQVNRPLTHAHTTRCVLKLHAPDRLSRAPRVTDIVVRDQVSGSDR